MNGRQCASRHDQAAIRYACKCRYVAFDVTGVAHVDRSYLDPKRRRHGLDGAELANPNGYGGVPDDCYPLYSRHDLPEQLQPFPADAEFKRDEPGGVSTRPRQTINETGADRIDDDREHDWYGTGRLLQCRGMTSGASATNSAAYLRVSAALPADRRYSIRTLWPSVQPDCCRPCWNALRRACPTGSSAASGMSTPMRRIPPGCCARAPNGHAAAAPPSNVTNSRLLIQSPRRRGRATSPAR